MSSKALPTTPDVTVTDWRPVEAKSLGTKDGRRCQTTKPWKPVTLRLPYLASMIICTTGLIVVVQYLLTVSGREQGIIFAQDINALPLGRAFAYLYLPTIISVLYSFLWTWVDLDIKRLELFYQLSKTEGALGHNSVLLSYPLEFLVTIPWAAFKRRHWSVLTASTIMILVFWGLTPTQAGIFTVRTVQVVGDVSGKVQASPTRFNNMSLSTEYAQSVYNIAWLNETLPPFMTKEYTLNPFGPASDIPAEATSTAYTGTTTMYSVDVSCVPAILWHTSGGLARYNGSQDCSFYAPPYRPRGGNDSSKPFDTIYVGYQNQDGFADYYLSPACDSSYEHHFFVRWSKATEEYINSDNAAAAVETGQVNETSLFCIPTYFQQEVNATIGLPSNTVISVSALGEKTALLESQFNSSMFEWTMSSGMVPSDARADYPVTGFPDQQSRLLKLPLNLAYLPKMAPFAIATYPQTIEAYMDPGTLQSAYQAAYRLLFARQLADVLNSEATNTTSGSNPGQLSYSVQAVVVVPVFAWIATAVLSAILALAITLTVLAVRRRTKLQQDPGTIGSLMDLASGQHELLSTFVDLDRCTSEEVCRAIGQSNFELQDCPDGGQCRIVSTHDSVPNCVQHSTAEARSQFANTKGVRPHEMSLSAGGTFLAVQVSALVIFLTFFVLSKLSHGLALPSQSTFTRQLVENYIPIVFATCIEPFWLVLNRLLSLLQPFEELRQGKALASRSIDLDYSSLPPQLLFIKAFKARHFALGSVCIMALSANILAVALSGMMYEGSVDMTTPTIYTSSKSAHVISLNVTGLPLNAQETRSFQGGTTLDAFYRQMSNLTADTPLPPWTDKRYAYVPVDLNARSDAESTIELETRGYTTSLSCKDLGMTGQGSYELSFSKGASLANLTVSLEMDTNHTVQCSNLNPWTRTTDSSEGARSYINDPSPGHSAVELNAVLSARNGTTEEDLFCRQNIFLAWVRADWHLDDPEDKSFPPNMTAHSLDTTAILCTPRVAVMDVVVLLDHKGQVQRRLSSSPASDSPQPAFWWTNDLVAQANQFLVDSVSTWHNDSYPSDFINYLIEKSSNDTSLLDPALPVPSAQIAIDRFSDLYQKLFAIFFNTNSDYLLENVTHARTIDARVTTTQTRILFSTPAFVVVEIILSCYIGTTIFFYIRRPWRVLPRLPSTAASIIAFFAASRAINEVVGKAARSKEKWAFGTFVGIDGKLHRGIEREPLLPDG